MCSGSLVTAALVIVCVLWHFQVALALIPLGYDHTVQGYSVTYSDNGQATKDTTHWATFVDSSDIQDASRIIECPSAATEDDSWMNLINTPFSIPFFPSHWAPRSAQMYFYPTSNGFLSATSWVMCPYFCMEYQIAYKGTYSGGVWWPMIALYVTDLHPYAIFQVQMYKMLDGSVLVDYNNVPLFASRAPYLLNLTAQAQLYTNGTIIFRYRSVPPSPKSGSDIIPVVGLFLSYRQRLFLEVPRWVGEEPTTVYGMRTTPLTYSAARIDPKPTLCSQLMTCAACTAQSFSCVWCSNFNGGACFNYEVAEDFCNNDDYFGEKCTTPSYVSNASFASPANGYYSTAIYETNFGPALTKKELVAVSGLQQLPFSFPLFYSPEQKDLTHPRMFTSIQMSASGHITLRSFSPSGPPLTAYINVLFGLLTPLTTMEANVGWGMLNQRINSSWCHEMGATVCEKAVYVQWTGLTTNMNDRFDFGVALHQNGAIEMQYFFARAQVNSSRAESDVLVAHYPPFAISITMTSEDGEALSRSFSWTVARPGWRLRFDPIVSCTPCLNGGKCNMTTKTCDCPALRFLAGPQCERCMNGFFPIYSDSNNQKISFCAQCPICLNGGKCDESTGACVCGPTFAGDRCEVACPNGITPCNALCNNISGRCFCGECVCEDDYIGEFCDRKKLPQLDDMLRNVSTLWIIAYIGGGIVCAVVVVVLRRKCAKAEAEATPAPLAAPVPLAPAMNPLLLFEQTPESDDDEEEMLSEHSDEDYHML